MTTTKVAIKNAKRANTGSLPHLSEAIFPCEQIHAGIEDLPHHYPNTSGYFPASELHYLIFEIPVYETIFGGYWCESCINVLDRKPGNTLEQDLRESIQSAVCRALHTAI